MRKQENRSMTADGCRITKQEFLKLWALPVDIQSRKKRISGLEEILRETEQVSDVVLSSHGCADATTLGHTVVTGRVQNRPVRSQLQALRQELREKNEAYRQAYPEAVRLIEAVPDPALRGALHLACLDGLSWDEVECTLGHGTADGWRMQVCRFADRNFS